MTDKLQRALTYTLDMPGASATELLHRVAQIQAQLNRALETIQILQRIPERDPGDDLAYGPPHLRSVPHRPDPTDPPPDRCCSGEWLGGQHAPDCPVVVGPYHYNGIPPWA